MSDGGATPARGRTLGAAAAGGIVGSLLTAGLLLLLVPQWIGPRLVRDAMLADPQILVDTADALRDRQFAPVIEQNRVALETPFGSSWKGAAKPEVVLVEFYDYACPYCKASNSVVDRLVSEDKGLRVVYRELPILGPASVEAARLSLAASKAGRFHRFFEAQYAAGRPSPDTIAAASKAAGIPPQLTDDPATEAELRRNFQLASQLGANGTPVFVVGNRVLNGAVGYDALKQAIEEARKRG